MLNYQYSCCLLLIGALFGAPLAPAASSSIHLFGFVASLCSGETNCFELRVEKEYLDLAAERIVVRYDEASNIYDPENYELPLQQSNIFEGSHLRLLLTPDPTRSGDNYDALFIWIGD